MAKDAEFLLKWLDNVNSTGLGATYADFESVPYTSTCGNDLSEIQEGQLFGPWTESDMGRHWCQPLFIDSEN